MQQPAAGAEFARTSDPVLAARAFSSVCRLSVTEELRMAPGLRWKERPVAESPASEMTMKAEKGRKSQKGDRETDKTGELTLSVLPVFEEMRHTAAKRGAVFKKMRLAQSRYSLIRGRSASRKSSACKRA